MSKFNYKFWKFYKFISHGSVQSVPVLSKKIVCLLPKIHCIVTSLNRGNLTVETLPNF